MIERIATGLTNASDRSVAAIFLTTGLVLLFNPLYLDGLSVYPGIGWGDLPLFYAALGTLGILSLGVGTALAIGLTPELRPIFTIAGVGIVGFGLYDLSLFVFTGLEFELSNYATRRLLVSSLVAAAFAFGAVARFGDRRAVTAAVALPLPSLVILLVDWRFDPILAPVLDLLFFLRAEVLLGIPYLGSVLLIIAVLLGVGWTDAE